MSFASNRSPIKVGGVTRGRVVVGGGLKRGGFSIYGSAPRRGASKSPAFQTSTKTSELPSHRLDKAKADIQKLQDRREVRQKSGKLKDTEGMQVEEIRIKRELSELNDHYVKYDRIGFWLVDVPIVALFVGLWLIVTPFWVWWFGLGWGYLWLRF